MSFLDEVSNKKSSMSKKGTNIIEIIATSPHPSEAALIANTVANSYKLRDKNWSNNESQSLKGFLQDRLNEKELELDLVEKKIEDYKRLNHIFSLEGEIFLSLLGNK